MTNTSFDFKRIAQGYKNRPFLHKQVIEKFISDTSYKGFKLGLDIGCGAGLSTKGLRLICSHVIGTDISPEMIEVAKEVCENDESIEFLVGKAEDTDISGRNVDIVTAAGAIQWINREQFLEKMRTVMKKDGYLLIYDFAISDNMIGCEAYTDWWYNVYLKEFPRPYRNESVWKSEDVEPFGFKFEKQVDLELRHEFDLESFIEFMMIQSNVNAKIEGEGRNVEEIHKWFESTLANIFLNPTETLIFKGYSWYIRKI